MSGQRHAEAVAVKDRRIVFVGSNQDVAKFRGAKTRIIDLGGHTVVPGMTDSHCHIFGIGEREMNLNLEGTHTREDFLAKVKERVAKTEPGKWITGRGWIETFWKPPQFPTRHIEKCEDRQGHAESIRWRNFERQNNRRTDRDVARQSAGPCRQRYSETD
jgi:predicted amidohydrolase YtcJ